MKARKHKGFGWTRWRRQWLVRISHFSAFAVTTILTDQDPHVRERLIHQFPGDLSWKTSAAQRRRQLSKGTRKVPGALASPQGVAA
jgi:hypothetical protein